MMISSAGNGDYFKDIHNCIENCSFPNVSTVQRIIVRPVDRAIIKTEYFCKSVPGYVYQSQLQAILPTDAIFSVAALAKKAEKIWPNQIADNANYAKKERNHIEFRPKNKKMKLWLGNKNLKNHWKMKNKIHFPNCTFPLP